MAWGDKEVISGGLFGTDKVVTENWDGSKTVSDRGLFGDTPVANVSQGIFGGTTVTTPSGNSESVSAPMFSGQSDSSYVAHHAHEVASGIDNRAASKSSASRPTATPSSAGNSGGSWGGDSYDYSYDGTTVSHPSVSTKPAHRSQVSKYIRKDKQNGRRKGDRSLGWVAGVLVVGSISIYVIYFVLMWIYGVLVVALQQTGQLISSASVQLVEANAVGASVFAMLVLAGGILYWDYLRDKSSRTKKRVANTKSQPKASSHVRSRQAVRASKVPKALVVQAWEGGRSPLGSMGNLLVTLMAAPIIWFVFVCAGLCLLSPMLLFVSTLQWQQVDTAMNYVALVPTAVVFFVPMKSLQL